MALNSGSLTNFSRFVSHWVGNDTNVKFATPVIVNVAGTGKLLVSSGIIHPRRNILANLAVLQQLLLDPSPSDWFSQSYLAVVCAWRVTTDRVCAKVGTG
jgi:hypothetical protein